MITTPLELRAKIFDLTTHNWMLAATGVLFETSLADQLAAPRALAELTSDLPASRVARLLDLLVQGGLVGREGDRYRLAEGALPFVQPPMRVALLGEIRSHLLQPLAFLDAPAKPAWSHTDARLLQAQGDASTMLAGMFKQMIVPSLDGLAARLEGAGARFLDVGVGVAALAIGLCRAFPAVSVVGLDPYDVPLALAKANVARAGMGERVELRALGLEALADDAAFDAAWVPGFFVPPAHADAGLRRLHAAMRPGGWVVFASFASSDPRIHALGGLVTDLWGGTSGSAAEATAALTRAGFATTRVLPGPPWAPAMLVAQR